MTKKQITNFALAIDPCRGQWRIITGPRRKKYLYHVEACAAWSTTGEKLSDADAFALSWSYAMLANCCEPI